ncbi:DUF6440 family protein [Clostridium estertheticum]|uniref:DUF6440 family protein n=1 Tax=Clostridium estertheticum TaxID=238834 RepID=UPI0013EEC7F3|nr:DUF6440 family protein [Clostridium estertheticum]MBZ9608826.1 DUF6440 family protein [Clostridium estertheticum]
MFNKNDEIRNKTFKTVCNRADALAVRCKILVDTDTVTNYLINIEDYAGGITVLLDKDGNPMFSQVKL